MVFFFQNPGLRVFLVSGSPKDIRTLYVALTHRVENLKLSTTSSSPKKDETSGTAKRKLDDNDTPNDESPPAEKEPKVA